jgi:LCP family protein required for cell wall assembly
MVTATVSKRAATMSEWPEGWFRGGESKAADGPAAPGAADPTVSIPSGAPDATNAAGQYQVRDYSGARSPGGGAAPPGSWPAQPPTSTPGRSIPRRGGRIPGGRGWRNWSRGRQVGTVVASLVVLLIVALVASYFYLNSQLDRQNVLVNYAGRPAPGAGTNWLITGSDSRQGLTRKQELQLSVGRALGSQRSDTILILHLPAGGGRPLLISVPRDSYVNIPGHGYNKINAAYSFGGPALLAETIQDATGLYINHYMGIGFGGFVNVVNAVGGVRMCLAAPLHDVSSGVSLGRGCQTLNGTQALAYVRDRHNFTTQDLQREQDQRLFLKALLSKMTSLGVMLNPFAAWPAASGTVSTLTVDDGTSLYSLYGVARALRNPLTTTVPIASANYITAVGDAVQWNTAQVRELFGALQAGQPVPKSLITGSQQAP